MARTPSLGPALGTLSIYTLAENYLHDTAKPEQSVEPKPQRPSYHGAKVEASRGVQQRLGLFAPPEGGGAGAASVGMRVKVARADGKEDECGTVRYTGTLDAGEGEEPAWVGVQFDHPVGNCAGTRANREYFRCKPQHGCFLPTAFVLPLSAPEALAELAERGAAALWDNVNSNGSRALSLVGDWFTDTLPRLLLLALHACDCPPVLPRTTWRTREQRSHAFTRTH